MVYSYLNSVASNVTTWAALPQEQFSFYTGSYQIIAGRLYQSSPSGFSIYRSLSGANYFSLSVSITVPETSVVFSIIGTKVANVIVQKNPNGKYFVSVDLDANSPARPMFTNPTAPRASSVEVNWTVGQTVNLVITRTSWCFFVGFYRTAGSVAPTTLLLQSVIADGTTGGEWDQHPTDLYIGVYGASGSIGETRLAGLKKADDDGFINVWADAFPQVNGQWTPSGTTYAQGQSSSTWQIAGNRLNFFNTVAENLVNLVGTELPDTSSSTSANGEAYYLKFRYWSGPVKVDNLFGTGYIFNVNASIVGATYGLSQVSKTESAIAVSGAAVATGDYFHILYRPIVSAEKHGKQFTSASIAVWKTTSSSLPNFSGTPDFQYSVGSIAASNSHSLRLYVDSSTGSVGDMQIAVLSPAWYLSPGSYFNGTPKYTVTQNGKYQFTNSKLFLSTTYATDQVLDLFDVYDKVYM